MKRYEVKKVTYRQPGVRTWETIKVFNNAADADDWLCKTCRENHLSIEDFTISRVEK